MEEAKTLKKSHKCTTAKKKKQGDEEYAKTSRVAKQIVQVIGGEHEASTLHAIALNNIPEHALQQFLQTRTREDRAARREAVVEKLMQTAF